MNEQSVSTSTTRSIIQLAVILILLNATALHSYVLFHFVTELFSIIIAFGIFSLVWNSRKYLDNNYFIFIGIALLFVGVIDLVHVLSYGSFNIFSEYGIGLSSQLWVAARFLGSFSFLIAPFFIKRKMNSSLVLLAYFLAAFGLLTLIFTRIFPVTFIEGSGLTPFKIFSEYVIISFFFGGIIGLYRYRKEFDRRVFVLLTYALLARILMELAFTLYTDIYGLMNQIGHLLKVVAFYLSYLAIIETGLMKPYQVLFKNLKESERALGESEERYRILVETSPDAILVHQGSKILYVNSAGLKLFGAKSELEMLDRSFFDLVGDEDREKVTKRIKKLAEDKNASPLRELKYKRLDGSAIDVEVISKPILYNRSLATQTIVRSIAKRKQTEAELKIYTKRLESLMSDLFKFQLAVEDASDHIVITDRDGKIIYANKAAESFTGFSGREMMDKTPSLWGNYIVSKSPVEEETNRRAWDFVTSENPNFKGEVKNVRKDGKEYIADLNISPVKNSNNEVQFYVAIERDITKIKEIDKAKTEFVSLASHQLRTPLTSICLSAELLLRGAGGKVEESQKEFLVEINDAALRMDQLIGALLNVSRLELGTFTIKEEVVDVVSQTKKILAELNGQIEGKKLTLKWDYSEEIPAIRFDKNVFRIIIENLVTNSIRYTSAGGVIALEIKKQNPDILIRVSDNGCGIPAEAQDKIFNKLYRADNARAVNTEGNGLGLYIVKSIAEKAGVKIWFESKENIGTDFFVTIPMVNETV